MSGETRPKVAGHCGGPADAAPPWAGALLDDPGYLRLVRWVFHARLLCLLLATPAVLAGPDPAPAAVLSLLLLAIASLMFGLGNRQIRVLIRHPLLAMVDIALTLGLLLNVGAAQPAALTVVCSALLTGLLFPRRFLVVLTATLALGSLGAPRILIGTLPETWTGWLALLAGTPALVVSFVIIGVLMRTAVASAVEAREEVAAAVAAVGAADERARLARDMHDSVGKSLHGISMAASALRRTVDDDPVAARELAGELAAASETAAQEARTILVGLRQGSSTDRPSTWCGRSWTTGAPRPVSRPSSPWSAWSTPIPPSPCSWPPPCGRCCTTSPSTPRPRSSRSS